MENEPWVNDLPMLSMAIVLFKVLPNKLPTPAPLLQCCCPMLKWPAPGVEVVENPTPGNPQRMKGWKSEKIMLRPVTSSGHC